MDGTLVDTEPYWINTEYALVESYGNAWSDEHAHALVGSDLLDSGAYIAEHGKVPLEPHEIVDRLLDGVVAQVEERVPWRRGARRLLAELNAAGVPCALVTMSWRRFVDPIVAQLPPGSFQTIVTGEDVTRGQATPRALPPRRGPARRRRDRLRGDRGLRHGHAIGDRRRLPRDRGTERDAAPPARRGNVRRVARRARSRRVVGGHAGASGGVDRRCDSRAADCRRQQRRHRHRSLPARAADSRLLGGLAVAAIGVVAAGFALDRYAADDGPPPPPAPLDVWAPYWTLETTLPELPTRITSMREVSPFWYGATGAETITIDPEASVELTEEFLEIARDSNVAIVPSIRDVMPAGGMAAVLADPATRTSARRHDRRVRRRR